MNATGKRIATLATLTLLAFSPGTPCLAAPPTNAETAEINQVRLMCDPRAPLTREELKTVVALAKECGFSRVTEVSTLHIPPSAYYVISVKSNSIGDDKDVYFQRLRMDYEKFCPKEKRVKENVLREKGKFWVKQGARKDVRLAYFKVHDETINVCVDEKIKYEEARVLVLGFAYRGGHGETPELSLALEKEGIDYNQPTLIVPAVGVPNTYIVTFLKKTPPTVTGVKLTTLVQSGHLMVRAIAPWTPEDLSNSP